MGGYIFSDLSSLNPHRHIHVWPYSLGFQASLPTVTFMGVHIVVAFKPQSPLTFMGDLILRAFEGSIPIATFSGGHILRDLKPQSSLPDTGVPTFSGL